MTNRSVPSDPDLSSPSTITITMAEWTPYLSNELAPQGHVVELEPCETRDKPCHLYVTGVEDIEATDANPNCDNSWKTKPVVLMIHDIFGPNSGRHRQLADEWAKRIEGVVVLVDCFQGKGLMVQEASEDSQQQKQPPRRMGFNMFTAKTLWKYASGGATAFLRDYPFDTDIFPLLVDQVLPYLTKQKEVETFGMVGFSWGSWVVMKACAADPELSKYISCACHFHPSIKATEIMWGGDGLHLCRQVSCPQYFLVTKLEPKDWWPEGDAEDTLKSNKKVPYGSVEFSISPTETHGFMTRGSSSILDKDSTVGEIERGVKTSTKFMLKHLNSGRKESRV